MKNFIFVLFVALMSTVFATSTSAQTALPATSDTIAWADWKADTTQNAVRTEALKFANAGKYASEVTFDVKTIDDVVAITNVPSRSGKKETQLLVTFTNDKDEQHYALVLPNKYKSVDGTEKVSITMSRGDSDNTAVKRNPW